MSGLQNPSANTINNIENVVDCSVYGVHAIWLLALSRCSLHAHVARVDWFAPLQPPCLAGHHKDLHGQPWGFLGHPCLCLRKTVPGCSGVGIYGHRHRHSVHSGSCISKGILGYRILSHIGI